MIKITERSAFTPTETAFVDRGRAICFEPLQGGVKVWLKGKKESFVVPWDKLWKWGQQSAVNIPARRVSDAELHRLQVVLGTNVTDKYNITEKP